GPWDLPAGPSAMATLSSTSGRCRTSTPTTRNSADSRLSTNSTRTSADDPLGQNHNRHLAGDRRRLLRHRGSPSVSRPNHRINTREYLLRKADQHWEMAGLARMDGDKKDAD